MAAGGQPRTSSPAAGPLGQETSGTITSSYNTTLQDAAAGVGLSFQDKPYAYNHTDGNLLMLPQLLDAAGQKKSPIVILKEYLDDEPNLFRAREVFRKLDRDVDGMLGRWEFVTFVQLLPGFSKLKLRLNDLLGIYDVVDDTKCNAISMPELLASLRRKARGGRPASARRRRSRPSSAASSLSSRAQRLAEGFGTFGAPPAVTAALAAAATAATTTQTGAGDPPKPRSARLASRRTYDRPWSASAALPKREPSTTAPPNPFLLHPQKFSTVGTTPTPGRAVKLFEQNQVRTSLLESLPGGARQKMKKMKKAVSLRFENFAKSNFVRGFIGRNSHAIFLTWIRRWIRFFAITPIRSYPTVFYQWVTGKNKEGEEVNWKWKGPSPNDPGVKGPSPDEPPIKVEV